jgi:hypothetical protein
MCERRRTFLEKKYIKPELKIVIDVTNQGNLSNDADDPYGINPVWDDGSGGIISKEDDGQLEF